MSTQSKPFLTEEQYLEIERKADFKSEYYQGEMFAMGGAGEPHILITGNAYFTLRQQLEGRKCRIYTNEMRVRVTPAGLYTYPDLVVTCSEPRFLGGEPDTLLNPTIIIEVLSKSTENYDRGKKFEMYGMLDSLTEYVMISSLRIRAERYAREPDGTWNYSDKSNPEDTLDLKSIDCHLRLADLYKEVDFTRD
jgi:Uma2 family endonuclease